MDWGNFFITYGIIMAIGFVLFVGSIWRHERKRMKAFPERLRQMEEYQAERAKERGELATRFDAALGNLRDSTFETQRLISEIEREASNQTHQITYTERRLQELANREASLQERLKRLQAVDPEATREMAALVGDLMAQSGKRDRRRDYALFLAGVMASAAVSLLSLMLG